MRAMPGWVAQDAAAISSLTLGGSDQEEPRLRELYTCIALNPSFTGNASFKKRANC